MHGFGSVAYGGCSEGQVFNQAQDAHSVFGGDVHGTLEVLLHVFSDFRILQVLLRRHGHHQAAGNIFGQTGDFVRHSGYVLFADVGQQQVDLVVAGRHLHTFGRAGDTASIQGFVEVHHLDEFVLDVAGLGNAIVF